MTCLDGLWKTVHDDIYVMKEAGRIDNLLCTTFFFKLVAVAKGYSPRVGLFLYPLLPRKDRPRIRLTHCTFDFSYFQAVFIKPGLPYPTEFIDYLNTQIVDIGTQWEA